MARKVLLIACMFLTLWIAAPARADRFEDLIKAIHANDVARVDALLDEDASLVNVRRDGDSAVNDALFILVKGEGFRDPKSNLVLQRVLARKPKLDLHETAALGSAAELRKMLTASELVKKPNRFGWTPLHVASFAGNVENVRLLLDRGADVNLRAATKFRNNPLQISLLIGHYDVAKLLLDRGADAMSRQAKGFTPMQEAAFLGRRDLAELLIERGAEINSRSDDGRTPLTEAIRGGHTGFAEWLKAKGGVGDVEVNKSPDE